MRKSSPASRASVSRGFLSALGGVAITVSAWFSSAIWPAWPALAALHFLGDALDPSSRIREAVVVFLIALNVTTWGVAIHLAGSIVLRIVRSPLPSEPPEEGAPAP